MWLGDSFDRWRSHATIVASLSPSLEVLRHTKRWNPLSTDRYGSPELRRFSDSTNCLSRASSLSGQVVMRLSALLGGYGRSTT